MLFYWIGTALGYGGPSGCSYSDPGSDQAKLMMTDRSETCDMVPLRSVSAGCGALVVVLVYSSCKHLGLSTSAAFCASLMVTFENLFFVMSRIHMNDMVYLCFLAAVVHCTAKVQRLPVGSRICWLTLSGLFLGAALTSRYMLVLPLVGWVGLQNLVYMLTRLGSGVTRAVLTEGILRAALLLLPSAAMYWLLYWLHLQMLPNPGSGSGYMTPEFNQAMAARSAAHPVSMGTLDQIWELTARSRRYHLEMAVVFPPGSHAFDSRWSSWPLMGKGIYWSMVDNGDVQSLEQPYRWGVFLSGNIAIWWTCTAAVALCPFVAGAAMWKARSGLERLATIHTRAELLVWCFLGYCLHLLPFAVLERQAFLHYYLPAYYFAILTTATLLDMLPPSLKFGTMLVLTAVGIGVWWHVLPFSTGSTTFNYHEFLSRAKLMTGECWYLDRCWLTPMLNHD
eukprot:TRINITY_DN17708_c0_g1_i2.p1 TRINITY_DN17708_c0_g1~~TRINITY_DN17708_c0_g1_i2.p1  ORF type:complete len:451 (+),score=56.85 TRINITY_DN17708_c0_g1_i2:392-1744(+)